MNIHKNARLTPLRREEMARAVVEGRLSKANAARVYGVTVKIVGRWVARFRCEGPPLCGQGGGWALEGRNPSLARQAARAREDQAGGAHDAARETAERDPLEHAQHGGGGRHLLQ